ncbi:MAG TPA: hypothetical protein VFL83_09555 [Anaeromyxobacter sp.]|nr:hypothetical protein [Anaeromyxobacter sp.]
MRAPSPRALALAALAALSGCATAGPAAPERSGPCDAAFARADRVLRAALASYVAEMKRFAASRDPGASTAAAEQRARTRADAWSTAHRPEIVSACRGWPDERLRCVLGADSPQGLSACGLDDVVASFTDDVVASFAARPVEPGGAPER